MAGIDYDNILNLIYELESSSGKNKKAYTPNEVGALGGYQLTPGAFQDLQGTFGKKWVGKDFNKVAINDNLAREAAADYLKIISAHLVNNGMAPTRDALLIGYHSGMGNAAKGNIGPRGMQYLSRAKALGGFSQEY